MASGRQTSLLTEELSMDIPPPHTSQAPRESSPEGSFGSPGHVHRASWALTHPESILMTGAGEGWLVLNP